jgi:signal transduction histidine kinase
MDGPGTPRGHGAAFDAPLWRALAAFRIAALAYALILIAHNVHVYAHPVAAWVVGGVMTVWTFASIYLYSRRPWHRRWPLLVVDLVIMGTCLLVSVPIIGIGPLTSTRTLPGTLVAGTVVAWAIADGKRGGTIAAVLIGAADLSTRGIINQNTLNSAVLLLLAAITIGHVSRLGVGAQERLERAVQMEATTRTRERLAREIHDSVLQVLSLVARRAQDLGGEAADLGRLAGEQEVVLRRMIGATEAAGPDGDGLADVRGALDAFTGATVTVAVPATVVVLPARVADELVAAVGCALDNVAVHAGSGARAWVLLEDDAAGVTVTVRDDGTGFPAGRLEQAAADGRLGVAQSIHGRLRDVGGTSSVTSRPGHGTEVELRVPRPR